MPETIIIPLKSGQPREGVIGYRNPDGSIARTVHFGVGREPGKFDPEDDVSEGIIRDMVNAFAKAMDLR